uniref:GNAT family N-acetyltransferase n=1 Tax=Roseihalotalea indica TaxID=2867963 RepID=A0AA49GKM3_9BACT|nr:GNAT family N-acetyltransferase [Tunicatimonas sp. TK19036]
MRASGDSMPNHLMTERLRLRKLTLDDLDEVHYLHTLPQTDQYNTIGIPKNKAATQVLMQSWLTQQQTTPGRHFLWVIMDKSTQAFIGLIALNLREKRFQSGEVWYKLLPEHWKKGYATEALNGILQWSFEELHLHRIEAGCATENIASIRVLEKVGMQKEGRKRKVLPIRGKWVDNYEYAILEEDWLNIHQR